MKKIVFTILENVCAENGKPYDAVDLLNTMKKYGTVESYDDILRREKAEEQKVIDGLTAQLNAVKDLNLTNDEICLVNAYRTCKAENERVLKAEKEVLSKKLTEAQEIFASTMGKIKDIVG